MVEEILDAGADASFPKKYARAGLLPPSPLYYALSTPRPDLTRRLLRQGARVDEKYFLGLPTLIRAVKDGHIENVRVLVEEGANINAATLDGATAVMECFKEQGTELQILIFLLSNGGSVTLGEQTPSGAFAHQTPVFRAALLGATDAIDVLVRYGANPNERYRFKSGALPFGISDKALRDAMQNGGTALMLATAQGHLSAAKSLVKLGADPGIAIAGTTGKHTALSLARASGQLTLVRYLEGLRN